MFRTNLLRACHRLHVGVKSTMVASNATRMIVPTSTTTRAFASSVPSTSKAASSEAGGSSFIPSGILKGWYNTFGQSTSKYLTFFVLLLVIGEYTFQGITSALWTWANYGRTFETVDWSPFDELDEDEEEEEEEEEEEDDE